MPANRDEATDRAPLGRSSFADVTASDYPAAPHEDPEPEGRGRTSTDPARNGDGDLVARLRYLVESDRDRAVFVLGALPPDVLDAAYAIALPLRGATSR